MDVGAASCRAAAAARALCKTFVCVQYTFSSCINTGSRKSSYTKRTHAQCARQNVCSFISSFRTYSTFSCFGIIVCTYMYGKREKHEKNHSYTSNIRPHVYTCERVTHMCANANESNLYTSASTETHTRVRKMYTKPYIHTMCWLILEKREWKCENDELSDDTRMYSAFDVFRKNKNIYTQTLYVCK